MKAIFIDATKREVSEVQIEGMQDQVYVLLDCLSVVALSHAIGDKLWIDNRGAHKVQKNCFMFGEHQRIVGNGLLVGFNDDNGEYCDVLTTLEDVEKIVAFVYFAFTDELSNMFKEAIIDLSIPINGVSFEQVMRDIGILHIGDQERLIDVFGQKMEDPKKAYAFLRDVHAQVLENASF
jgi:hypothetical protein